MTNKEASEVLKASSIQQLSYCKILVNEKLLNVREALDMAIEVLERTGWTPVSGRLPEEDGCYLVTEKSGRVCTYVFLRESNSEEYWKKCTVAWMPLPKPYEPQESEDNE